MADTFKPLDAKKLFDEIRADPKKNELLDKAIATAQAEAWKRGATREKIAGESGGLRAAGGDTCGGCFSCLACGATPTPDIEVGALFTAFYVT